MTDTTDRPLRGIGLVLLSSIFSSVSDTIAKLLASELNGVEVVWLRYLVFCVIMIVIAGTRTSAGIRTSAGTTTSTGTEPLLRRFKANRPGLQVLRGLLIIASAVLFVLGLRFLPVAEATTTFYVAPVFVTALSILFLGESVGVRRWLATVAGLIGVVIVVRPGANAFNAAALYPLTSAAFWAGSLVVTRRMSALDRGSTTLFYSAIIGFAALSIVLPFVWVNPSWAQIGLGALIGLIATVGQGIIILAYRYGGASLLAPFSYAQIIWAAILGYLVFGERPGGWVLLGGSIIIASGVYTAHRERVRLRQLARTG